MVERSHTVGRIAIAAGVLVATVLHVHGTNTATEVDHGALRLVLGRCTVCHSTDLITQQRLPRAQWEGTIAKMVRWGAQLTDDEQAEVGAYLSEHFHPDAPMTGHVLLEDLMTPAERRDRPAGEATVLRSGDRQRGGRLFGQTCAPCHGPVAQGVVGPKLSRNPILGEPDRFRETVQQGRGAMPAWRATLSNQDVADIHAWLQSLD